MSGECESGKPDAEVVLWQGGYNGRALTGAWLTAGLLAVAMGIGGLIDHGWDGGLFLGLIGAVVFGGGVGLYLAYRKLAVHYVLTDRQFVCHHGLLRRRADPMDVIEIDDVAFWQRGLQRWWGVGTVKIISSDRSRPDRLLYGIHHVADVAAEFDRSRRAERIRRGLFIERPGTNRGAGETAESP